jgi:predicted regulator of Ras-like GTPase activity (Roadblock/LC7/MglB family)
VSIGDRLKRWRDLARLRRQARCAPSPSAFGELAERLISLGETDAALGVAEEGLGHFPDSERLSQVRLFAKKGRLTGQLRRLRDDVVRRPTPVVFTQLAAIYRELGQHDDALQTAQDCAERFPLNENPYLIQGEIRLERFLRDFIARDAVLAEAALRRVTRINGHNVKAHLLLAELYWLVGAVSSCRRHLRSVLTITPTARDVQDFVREVGAPDAAETDAQEDFEELARSVEEQGAFVHPAERFPNLRGTQGDAPRTRARLDVESLKTEVVELGSHQGVRNSIVLDKDGEPLADCTDGMGLTRKQFAELVTSIAATADDASKRMDTGALVRAEIESPSGNITVARVRNLTIGILYADPLRGDRVWEILQDFVARNLTTTEKEGARA